MNEPWFEPNAFGAWFGAIVGGGGGTLVGLLGAMAYWKAGHIDMRASLLVALGLFFGALVGARIALVMPAAMLQRAFAVFLVAVAVRMFLKA